VSSEQPAVISQQQEFEVAAPPPRRAERLCLSVERKYFSTCEAVPHARFTVRRSLLTFLLLLLTAHSLLLTANAAWTRQQSGTMAWLHAVYFLDQNHGWVAGSNGALLETTDGGRIWRKLHLPTDDTFRDIFFINGRTGWLVCDRDVFKLKSNDEPRSYLMKTDDGGLSWRRIAIGSNVDARLLRALFTDEDHGWVFGESGALFTTHNGGATWTAEILPTKHLLLGGAFGDKLHGCLVGAGATILHTSDGGATWHAGLVRDSRDARLTAATFVGNRLGWAVGAGGQIFASTDGGRTWFAETSNVSADLFDVKFLDAIHGWAVGAGGLILATNDGGIHWTIAPSGTSHALERIFVVDQNHVWAVGFGGTIISYVGSSSRPPALKARVPES
jgi:photosystem II stability/assembly factor-like uncharacterized protein